MFIKRLLISLGTLGIAGGTSIGIYYSLKENDQKTSENADLVDTPFIQNKDLNHQELDQVTSDEDKRNDEVENNDESLVQNVNKNIQNLERVPEGNHVVEANEQGKILVTVESNEETSSESRLPTDTSLKNDAELTSVLKIDTPDATSDALNEGKGASKSSNSEISDPAQPQLEGEKSNTQKPENPEGTKDGEE